MTLAAIAVFAATCNIAPVLSDQFRSSIVDLAVDGNDLWAATSYGVAVYDRSVDPPRLVASLPVPGNTRLVRLGNGVAYAGSFAHRIVGVDARSGRVLLRFPHGFYVPVSGNGGRLLLHGYSRLFAVEPRRRR